ncbi:hypothetical protein GCM10009868_05590 [Terrabacter aerolatus]|uniref:Uncharacterized protein n=1 Tax=Terrabacter aerolatus TaxID=422442 RepID=A0A512D0S7_9MICO|nr:hypothetical protein [Terrabacter aerolatus]GEO30066.1 hypothetical protein TAE01_18760 [Terrabacter aerolatus]
MPPAAPSPHAQTSRALVLAATASGGATIAHAVGGGHLVSGTGVVVATAVLTGATLPFVRDRLSVPRAAALLVALQVVAHLVHGLAALAGGPAGHGRATDPVHAAHGIRPLGRIETDAAGATDAAMSSALTDLLPSPAMLLAHAVAAVALGLVLTRGERSWWVACLLLALLGAATSRVVRLLTCGAVALWRALVLARVGLPGPLPQRSDGRVPSDVWRARTPVRRGPPALLLT